MSATAEQMDLPLSQRWNRRRTVWVPHRAIINPGRHEVVRIEEGDARAFCAKHHYTGSTGAQRAAYGIFRKYPHAAERLVGVLVFGVPVQPAAGPRWCGLAPKRVVDLNRLCATEELEANGESFFVSRAMRQFAQAFPDVDGLVSYSDPVPRHTEAGEVVMPGHVGIVYQALSMRYVGRSAKRVLFLDRDGRALSERSLSKIRNNERGASGAIERLLEAGAPAPRGDESGRDYVTRVLAEGPFRRMPHPGNHVYVATFPGRRAAVRENLAAALPFPRKAANAPSLLPLAA